MSKKSTILRHKNYMTILRKLLRLVIREPSHNDSKNLKRINYILICVSSGLLVGIKFP